jgi:hypothetical protein
LIWHAALQQCNFRRHVPKWHFCQLRGHWAKQDCERAAAKRWLARHGAGVARFRPVYLGDDLHACQPIVQAIQESGGSFILTCKPGSHQTITEYLTGVDLQEHRQSSAPRRPPASIAGSPRFRCAAPPML